jgi:hypothetical protein
MVYPAPTVASTIKCVVREGGRRRRIHHAANYSFHPPEKGKRAQISRRMFNPTISISETVFHRQPFSFMGLRYFPQLEAAMRKVNFPTASEKGLTASTIPEADNSLPHLIWGLATPI